MFFCRTSISKTSRPVGAMGWPSALWSTPSSPQSSTTTLCRPPTGNTTLNWPLGRQSEYMFMKVCKWHEIKKKFGNQLCLFFGFNGPSSIYEPRLHQQDGPLLECQKNVSSFTSLCQTLTVNGKEQRTHTFLKRCCADAAYTHHTLRFMCSMTAFLLPDSIVSFSHFTQILMSKEPSYVRCIKPNDAKQSGKV